MPRSYWLLKIDGNDVTNNFDPVMISLKIKDTEGGKSDSLEAELDDTSGQIELPRTGATIYAEIGWVGGGCITFDGKTDEPHSRGSRGGGQTLSLSAKSADQNSTAKQKAQRHKDNASFGDVAQEWGQQAGLDVKVDASLTQIQRPYWDMSHESFYGWGARIACELGATFKVSGGTAIFVARGSGESAGGAALTTVNASRPGNIINWDMTPVFDANKYASHKARWYDRKQAKWQEEEVTTDDSDGANASLREHYKHGSQDRAKTKAQSNKSETDRKKGGGTILIDGEPAARSQAPCEVSGLRPGIDGTYKITDAEHTRHRKDGYTTQMTLEQPSGDAGTDKRKKAKSASGFTSSSNTQVPGNSGPSNGG
ncbi:phage late control D family protein [Methylovirgula sp. 4M-Z18]|uniref:phage late control D family protein n=1 Tax=Methylovirgula sp. 4M-Z18 TaxID=2293567 RepID=UPI000E2EE968|nr:hypothetical protein [Methylovirgula sp. 4M-Z18]RFB80388.1 hypothetical protein DYH55_02350 [Methylovirgula sp. 4M-Z18]